MNSHLMSKDCPLCLLPHKIGVGEGGEQMKLAERAKDVLILLSVEHIPACNWRVTYLRDPTLTPITASGRNMCISPPPGNALVATSAGCFVGRVRTILLVSHSPDVGMFLDDFSCPFRDTSLSVLASMFCVFSEPTQYQ